ATNHFIFVSSSRFIFEWDDAANHSKMISSSSDETNHFMSASSSPLIFEWNDTVNHSKMISFP
ncbi:unnamed protein product, partial [Rotaria socialis]